MSWFDAWLLVNIGWFKGFLFILGICVLGILIWRLIAHWDVYTNSSIDIDITYKRMKLSFIKLFPIIFFLWLIASLLPTTKEIFKIVAVKYGYDIATSQRAEKLARSGVQTVEKSLDLLNSKLDDWKNKK
jgi:hypothetical protein